MKKREQATGNREQDETKRGLTLTMLYIRGSDPIRRELVRNVKCQCLTPCSITHAEAKPHSFATRQTAQSAHGNLVKNQ